MRKRAFRVKIIDNFLEKELFFKIYDTMYSDHFGWFIQKSTDKEKDNNYQLTHLFYENDVPNSSFFDLLTPILEKLGVNSLIRVKSNLTFYDNKIDNIFHIDRPKIKLNHKTSILYLTEGGGTVLKNEDKEEFIEAKENRLLTFDSHTQHKVVKHKVGEPFRIVINFNYF